MKTFYTYMHQSIQSLAHLVLLVIGVFSQVTFGLNGIVFVFLMSIYFTSSSILSFALKLFFISLFCDVVFLRPLGSTGVTYGIVCMFWQIIQKVSRWRFLFFLIIGIFAELFLVYLSSSFVSMQDMSTALIVVSFGWFIIKRVQIFLNLSNRNYHHAYFSI